MRTRAVDVGGELEHPVEGQSGSETSHSFANGFRLNMSNADTSLIWTIDGEAVEVVHMSFTLAKTLHVKLGELVARMEEGLGRSIPVTAEVTEAMQRVAESDEGSEGGDGD